VDAVIANSYFRLIFIEKLEAAIASIKDLGCLFVLTELFKD
jgi:hypothetical protein